MTSQHGEQHASGCCAGRTPVPSVAQTLEEMEWERGIWPAALEGDVERLQTLLAHGTPADLLDSAGYTPLHYAARAGHLPAVSLLLAAGAAADARTAGGGATALHRAASRGWLAVTARLMAAGALPAAQDARGWTALHWAADAGQLDMCRMLLQHEPRLASVRDARACRPADLAKSEQLRRALEDR